MRIAKVIHVLLPHVGRRRTWSILRKDLFDRCTKAKGVDSLSDKQTEGNAPSWFVLLLSRRVVRCGRVFVLHKNMFA